MPPFLATPIPQKIYVEQLFGSSDSEAVSDFDYRNVGGGESDSFEDEAKSPEELYSEENSHHFDSGDSTGSNYESTSSFEERKRKAQNRRSHGSATSKAAAAAAGRRKCRIVELVLWKIHLNRSMPRTKPLQSEKHQQLQIVVRIAVVQKPRVMRKAVAMVAARLEATAPPQQYPTRARAKQRQHQKNRNLPSPANGSKQRRKHRLQQISMRIHTGAQKSHLGYQYVELRKSMMGVKKVESLWWTVTRVKSVQGQEGNERTRGKDVLVGVV